MDDWRPSALKQLHETVYYSLTFGAGYEYRKVRDEVAALRLGGDALGDVMHLDELALEHVIDAPEEDVWPGILEDDAAQPIERWWWHLGAIRAGTFPPEHLPAPLRAVMETSA